jgi:hypothetical protein
MSTPTVNPVPPTNIHTEPEKDATVIIIADEDNMNCGKYIYMCFHMYLSLIAYYIAFRCNNGFNPLSFLVATFCPYLYLAYVLSSYGTCDRYYENGPVSAPVSAPVTK